jgi:hypothetical protein
MTLQTIKSRLFELRSLLVIAALSSLCVSNNVGPSFLPLPDVTERVALDSYESQGHTASRLPSAAGSDSLRVPMTGHTQKRAA